MASTRNTLAQISGHLDESIGQRRADAPRHLAPVASAKDAGRLPLRNVGTIEIDRVVPDPDQPRAEFADESLDRLAQSLREKGQLLPIHVRWSPELSKWIIISGERRWRASKRAGLPTVECYFQEQQLSDSQVLEQQLIENLLREDLKPIEQARAFDGLMKLNQWNGKQVAEALRINESSVSRVLALLKLPEGIQTQVDRGEISPRSAYEISRVKDDRARKHLASLAITGNFTHDQIRKSVSQRRGTPGSKKKNLSLTFPTESGFKVLVTVRRNGSYPEVEAALLEVLEEVRHRIRNDVKLY